MKLRRKLGQYSQGNSGPLLVVIGAMHGNEDAGVNALKQLFPMLENEPVTNPHFTFHGTIVGLLGNMSAFAQDVRYIDRDMNRLWKDELIRDSSFQNSEINEIRSLLDELNEIIAAEEYTEMIVLDLHTTTAKEGVFSIPNNDPKSLEIASQLHAPVIKGLIEGIGGTSLHYFNTDNFNIDTTAVVFESGQHNEPKSVLRAIAAIINCMRTCGMVDPEVVENRHDQILEEFCRDKPRILKLAYCHEINAGDEFVMKPGYVNFQPVSANELIAEDRHGEIRAKESGLMLMPLYQKQGEDGFFIIKPA